jgi:glycerol uptake facilitator-like aquaporin
MKVCHAAERYQLPFPQWLETVSEHSSRVQEVPPDHTIAQAFVGEASAAFILVLVMCFFGLDKESPRADGERIPLVVAFTIPLLIFTVGPVSSMCINPARAFGPAVVSGFWEHHWIWWTAPFLGGLAAILPYKALRIPNTRIDV